MDGRPDTVIDTPRVTDLDTGSTLLLSDDLSRTGMSDRTLQRALARGEVVRIRRGAYCRADRWAELDSRERQLVRMHAVAAVSGKDIVFCGPSAAAAWHLPRLAPWTDEVHVAVADRAGGRSSGDVRRRVMDLTGVRVNEVGELLVTGLASTAVQQALEWDFPAAVGVLDAARRTRDPGPVTREELLAELARLRPRRHASRALTAVGFSVAASESFGESITRARLHELGYPPPVLQAPISDERGLIGRVDFYWPDYGVIGEFDGAVKYERPEYLQGKSPAQVVWLEKQREDRLRRRSTGFFRAIWADVMDPARLDSIVRSSGLRRSPR
ncbi:MAG: hypothetical protein JWP66_1655 [Naasia sp.]|nr:hypothetical protein [Naasia sp.]